MRRLTEPEAHRARVRIIEGEYPEGLRARCAWCDRVRDVHEGAFVELLRSAEGPSRLFRCDDCADKTVAA